jgi:hypothetical protein
MADDPADPVLLGPRIVGILETGLRTATYKLGTLMAIHAPNGCVEITTTHVPPRSSDGWIKFEHLDGVRLGLGAAGSTPKLLCGHFNAPRRELPAGEVITFGQPAEGRLNRALGERWDAAERDILLGLADLGMSDVFRALYGYQPPPASRILRRGDPRLPRRFDHVLADPSLGRTAFTYVQGLREGGVSYHSPALVEFTERVSALRSSAGGKLRSCPASI